MVFPFCVDQLVLDVGLRGEGCDVRMRFWEKHHGIDDDEWC